jgi:N6-adenosine-specific RNA methylase IME4
LAAKIQVDPEFKALIAPLRDEERQQLEENLVAHGCRDPLVLWRGILIDGHNRYEICTRLKIAYQIVRVALPDRDRVLIWIERNQLGRRNLTDWQRAGIAQRLKKRLVKQALEERAKKGGKAGGVGRKKNSLEDTAASKLSERSRRSVSKAAKVSERKVRAVAELEKKLGAKLGAKIVDQIVAGEVTPPEINTKLRREERLERIQQMAAPSPLPQDQKYPVIYADPPWRYEYVETESRAIENQYPTMELAEICALPVAALATEHAVLFLWVSNPKLEEGMAVIKAWGFQYRTCMAWVKDRPGMGYYVRQQHELLLIAKRGEPPMPLPANRPASVITAPRLKHSAKPVEFCEAIERMYPELPKIELFSRAPRDGWAAWGNQAGAAAD